MRLFLFDTELDCFRSSAPKFARVNRNRCVGLSHICPRAVLEPTVLQLFHWISVRNSPELIEPAGRARAATLNSMFDRGIERSAIDTGLPARNDFHDAFTVAALYERRNREFGGHRPPLQNLLAIARKRIEVRVAIVNVDAFSAFQTVHNQVGKRRRDRFIENLREISGDDQVQHRGP